MIDDWARYVLLRYWLDTRRRITTMADLMLMVLVDCDDLIIIAYIAAQSLRFVQ